MGLTKTARRLISTGAGTVPKVGFIRSEAPVRRIIPDGLKVHNEELGPHREKKKGAEAPFHALPSG
jgi:hypothetical protein